MVEGRLIGLRAVLLLRARGRPLAAERATLIGAAATRQAKVIEVFSVGRTFSGVDRVRELSRTGVINCVVVASIATLARSEATQLSTVGELMALGVSVVSLEEPWVSGSVPISVVANWMMQRERTRRAAQVRSSLSRARASGVRIGRPRRTIPGGALQLARRIGIARAARELGLGESTLRRFVRAGSTSSQPQEVHHDHEAIPTADPGPPESCARR